MRKMMGCGNILEGPPPKPIRMHHQTYARLYNEYLDLLQMRREIFSMKLSKLPNSGKTDDVWHEVTYAAYKPKLNPDTSIANHFPLEPDQVTQGSRVESTLTLGQLANAAKVPREFGREAQREGLLRPDTGRSQRRKRYRPKLASWLAKLHTLWSTGYTWDELRNWSKRRVVPGNEDEHQWPTKMALPTR
jgi:hypothetical protein